VNESLHPSEGIRIRLCRGQDCGDAADYDADVFTPSEHFAYRALLRNDGSVDLSAIARSASPDEEKQLKNIAASVARAAKRNQEQGLPAWPDRVIRWRGPGRGSIS
jgi:hypothetical protein